VFDAVIPPESVVDRCTAAIREAILSGDIPVGSTLPPERRLAAQFDVHRGTVRSALDRLGEEGLLDVRQGRGYRVKDYRRSAGPGLLTALARVATSEGRLHSLVGDLLLVRRQLAVAVLERISERIEALPAAEWGVHRDALETAIDAFSAVVAEGGDEDDFAEADIAVVATLVAAADSLVFSLCMNPLASALRSIPPLRKALYSDPATNVIGWRLFLAWIDMPKPGGADHIVAELVRRDVELLAALEDSD